MIAGLWIKKLRRKAGVEMGLSRLHYEIGNQEPAFKGNLKQRPRGGSANWIPGVGIVGRRASLDHRRPVWLERTSL